MKKTFSIVFAALGMTACLALFVCFLLLGPSAAGANEVLSPPPSAVRTSALRRKRNSVLSTSIKVRN